MDKLKRARNLYKALQKDSESVFFGSEEIKNRHIKKARLSSYAKDKFFLALYINISKKEKFQAEPVIPSHIPFVEKKSKIDRSTNLNYFTTRCKTNEKIKEQNFKQISNSIKMKLKF